MSSATVTGGGVGPSDAPEAKSGPWGGRGLILALVCFAQFMVVLDATVVNIMAPEIQRSFTSSLSTLQWVMTSYVLVFGGCMLLGGRLTDVLGRRKVFFASLLLFTAASLFAGLSASPGELIAARVLQGIGAAGLSPAAMSIVVTTFSEPAMRAKALGVWGTVMGVGASCGTLIGGVVTEIDWRLGFFINVPVGVVLLLAIRRVPVGAPSERQRGGIDIAGAAFITGGLLLLVLAITRTAEVGWRSGQTYAALGASSLLLLAFVVVERRTMVPMLPLSLLRSVNVRVGSFAQFVAAGVMLPFFFLLPQYMQNVLGYSPIKTGLAYIPTSLSMIVVASMVPAILSKFGVRLPYVLGSLALLAGPVLVARAGEHATYWGTLLPITLLMGVGLVSCMMISPIVATMDASDEDAGAVSAVLNSSSEIGGAIGLAVAVTSVTSHNGGNFTNALQAGAVVMIVWAVINVLVGGFTMKGRPKAEEVVPARAILEKSSH
jgi:EmrB/QacA subfamily drug resistance transporter